MSRSGYVDDVDDYWQWICWRGAVASAIRGKRGQAFLRELLNCLDNLPKPELIADQLITGDSVCAIGAVGKARGVDMTNLDPYDSETVAATFGISEAFAKEIVWMNDEAGFDTGSYSRFERMRRWAIANLQGDLPSEPAA